MDEQIVAIFKVELNCPASCPSCSSRKTTFTRMRPRIMSLTYFEKCIQELATLGVNRISLSGGEPTLLHNLGEYIKVCHQYGISSQLFTSGWNVTDENLEQWLQNGLNTVVLSMYSSQAATFARLRRSPKLFPRAYHALEIIAHQRKKYDFSAILQTIIMPHNMDELPELLRLAIVKGFDLFWPSYLEDSINLPDLRMTETDINIFRDEVVPKLKFVCSLIHDSQLVHTLNNQIDTLFNHPGMNLAKVAEGDYGHIERQCPLVERFVLLYPNGAVAPCAGHEYFWSSAVEQNTGQGLERILFGHTFETFRQERMEYCLYCPHGIHIGLALRTNAHE